MKDWSECRDAASLVNDAMHGFATLLSTAEELNGPVLWRVGDLAELIARAQETVAKDMQKHLNQCPYRNE